MSRRLPPCRPLCKHWFSRRGLPGERTPYCVRGCGVANPKWEEELCAHVHAGGRACERTFHLKNDDRRTCCGHDFVRVEKSVRALSGSGGGK